MARNIVLLSDGTGNSAAKPFKTNVWRLFQALDLRDSCEPCQIALYDNGVGTENYKPLAALSGAFGIGVWRNVRDLYTFVCRNYNPDADDRIYVFGFSRGAFTVRLLCGLIGKCGIVKEDDESKLTRAVEMAYIEYRRDYLMRASETRHMIYPFLVREPIYEEASALANTTKYRHSRVRLPTQSQFWPDIAFLGLWDTVDAYGMPIDELKHGLDHWIWPMSVADRQLSGHVRRACHALSIDDARPAFRPVLWSEKTESGDPLPEDGRIKQVWFAGVHADVGGGYPDDAMAHVALDWIMGEAAAAGLLFAPGARDQVQCRANVHGEQHDSREGLAGYYRYGPRNIQRLCQDERYNVFVDHPKIHRSVLERIGRRRVDYSPVSLPHQFACGDEWITLPEDPYILTSRTSISAKDSCLAPPYLGEWMELASDAVWWRRVAYLSTVAATAVLVLFPLLVKWNWLLGPNSLIGRFQAGATDVLGNMFQLVFARSPDAVCGGSGVRSCGIEVVKGWTPSWSHPWLTSLAQHWVLALVLLCLVAWLFFRKGDVLKAKVNARAERGWSAIKQLKERNEQRPGWTDRTARWLRTEPLAVRSYQWLTREAIPTLFALTIGLFVLIAVTIKLAMEEIRRLQWFPRGEKEYLANHD